MRNRPRGLVKIEIETNFQLLTLRIGFGLATGPLSRGFESTETPDFVKNSFLIEFRLEALERAVNGFTFSNSYFWHE